MPSYVKYGASACIAGMKLRKAMLSRLLIVDDHEIVRLAVRTLFPKNNLFEVCGEAQNGPEAIRMVSELSPDLVILDLSLPGMNGIETAAKIRNIAPLIRIVLFSIHEIPSSVRWADVDGFVCKSSNAQELVHTVNRLLHLGQNRKSESDFYTGQSNVHISAALSETPERRRRPRINLSQVVRIRPFDPNLPPEYCTTVNVSQDGFHFVTSSDHYAPDMNVYLTSDYQPDSPIKYALTGLVVRVEKLEDDKWGVAIQIFPPLSSMLQ
jgi:DNA-binding NarL/FixJ family response regulator